MKPLKDKWAVMIDVTNYCSHDCLYCTKHVRHLRKDQLFHMKTEQVERAIDSLAGYNGRIGITGGEPLLNPYISEIFALVKKRVPKERAILFTSHKTLFPIWKKTIDATFGEVYINYHDRAQREVCLHQPLLLAVSDMIEDERIQQALIDKCWCNEMWSPVINNRGAFFCDCAAGLETILNLGGAWDVKPNWLERGYQDQKDKYCGHCGMCLPYPGQALTNKKEKISAGLYAEFQKRGMNHLDDMEVINAPLTVPELYENLKTWQPWHNRQDRGYEGAEYVNAC